MPKIRVKDVGAVCEKLGMKKFRRKFYDAPAIDEWRLVDSVGATLVEVSIYNWDGELSVLDTKIKTQADLDKVAKKIAIQVARKMPLMVAKVPDDKKIWAWLDRNGDVYEKEARYYTYTLTKNMLLFHCSEFSIVWAPFVNGSESYDIAGSSTTPVGPMGMTLTDLAAWLEKNGIHKKKREKTGRRNQSFSYYD